MLCSATCGRRGVEESPAFRRSSAIPRPARSSRGAARSTTPNAGAATAPIFAAASRADRICCAATLVLNDREGELIEQVLQASHKGRLSPAGLTAGRHEGARRATFTAFSRWRRDRGAPPPGPPIELKVLVGDAAAGERYFAARCASCHSVDRRSQGHRRARSRTRATSESLDCRRTRRRRRRRGGRGAAAPAATGACR